MRNLGGRHWRVAGPLLAVGILLAVGGPCLGAEEKKPEKKKEPPRVTVVIPLGVVPGSTNKIKVRGLNLTNATELRFAGMTNIVSKIKSAGKADVPKELDAKKIGDTQLEVELQLPDGIAGGTNTFTVVTPEGESEPHLLAIVSAGSLVLEKEPNGSFRQAQKIDSGQTVQGAIGEAKDVDVYRFEGKAGAELRAEVFASRYGSLLDSILTLYDDRAHVLVTADDTDNGTDAVLQTTLPADGTYFLSLIDAHDRGGPAHVYHLVVNASK